MRISIDMISFLKQETKKITENSKVYLFGSRLYNFKKGGDIDILLLTPRKLSFEKLSTLRINFYYTFGEQKLDIVNYTFKEKNIFKKLILPTAKEL